MNKSKQNKKTGSEQAAKKPQKISGVEIDYSKPLNAIYSNFSGVNHTINEYFIDFCLISPPYTVKVNQPVVMAQPITRVIIPAELAPLLVQALQVQIQQHQETVEQHQKDTADKAGASNV